MITLCVFKLLLIWSLVFIETSCGNTFNNVTLYSDSSLVERNALTFTINFNMLRDLDTYEAVVIKLPRFNSILTNTNNYIELSPSLVLEGTWVSVFGKYCVPDTNYFQFSLYLLS